VPVGQSYRPITEAETNRLQELAKSYVSLFHADEQGVAMDHPVHFNCPHSMA
jgi:hypothetical protein